MSMAMYWKTTMMTWFTSAIPCSVRSMLILKNPYLWGWKKSSFSEHGTKDMSIISRCWMRDQLARESARVASTERVGQTPLLQQTQDAALALVANEMSQIVTRLGRIVERLNNGMRERKKERKNE